MVAYLYLIQSKKHKETLYKIGVTTDFEKRLRDLNSPLPEDMLFYKYVFAKDGFYRPDSIRSIEKQLHDMFSCHRIYKEQQRKEFYSHQFQKMVIPKKNKIYREWFTLSEFDIVTIKKVLEKEGFELIINSKSAISAESAI